MNEKRPRVATLKEAKSLIRLARQITAERAEGRQDWSVISAVESRANFRQTVECFGEGAAHRLRDFHQGRIGHIDDLAAALSRGWVDMIDVVHDKRLKTTKTLCVSKYLVSFGFYRGDAALTVSSGARAVCVIHPQARVIVDIHLKREDPYAVLDSVLGMIVSEATDIERYLTDDRPQGTGLIAGEGRPSHFVRETLAPLQHLRDQNRLGALWESLDYVIAPVDRTFLPLDEVFEVPAKIRITHLPGRQLNRFIADQNLFVQLLARSEGSPAHIIREPLQRAARDRSTIMNWSPVKRAFETRSDEATVWFCVDVEKSRFTNQDEIFAILVETLNRRHGENFKIIFDGWSPMPYSFNSKDARIQGEIRHFIATQTRKTGVQFSRLNASALTYRDKIRLCEKADFFVGTQGSGAIVPGFIWEKPGILYHNEWGLSLERDIWPPNAIRLVGDNPSITAGHKGKAVNRDLFRIDPEAFRREVEQLLA